MTHDAVSGRVSTIRPASPADNAFIRTLSWRLDDGGLPQWHGAADFHAFHARGIEQVVAAVDAIAEGGATDQAVLVAESAAEGGRTIPIGVVHFRDGKNALTDEPQGYVAVLAVTKEAEGHGVGRALLEAAEAWARARGHRMLSLDTAGINARSRAFYRRGGYNEEFVGFVKILS
jgi:GNAT superfamily N-acetyltransferase